MRRDWRQYRVGDLGRIVTGRTPPTSKPHYFGDKYPFITPSDMDGRKKADSTLRYLSDEGAELLQRNLIPGGSVAVSCIGWQMGKSMMTCRPSFTNQQLNTIIPNEKADADFLYYALSTRREELLSLGAATGVRTPILNKSAFSDLRLLVPPLKVQRKIAAILSAYDDLIKNNTRRIATLEQMAQLLYREWFVHFRFPGHEDVEMVDSEFGPIPEGWEVRTLRQFGEVVLGKTPSKRIPEYYGDHMPFIKIPDMHGKIFCTQTTEYLSEKGAESQKKKTLSPNSLCVSCIGSAGIVNITTVPSQTNQQINSIVLQNEPDREFMYFALLELEPTIQQHGATGATMVNLSKSKFVKLRVAYPDSKTIGAYHGIVYPHFEAIKNLQLQNQVLRRTRDLLLPRLISGELDVSELAIDVGEEDDHG
jgi:type I restriction enzyme S subunit